jgi:hypothetical protein
MRRLAIWTLLSALAAPSVFAASSENALVPAAVTCGSFDEKERPLSYVDFEVKTSDGTINMDKLAKEYRNADYPFKSARQLSHGGFNYRLSANAFETAAGSGQYFLLMTIYEEVADGTLIQRAVQRRDFGQLKKGFDVRHNVMNSKKTVACLAKTYPAKKDGRVPAKSVKAPPKSSSTRAPR